MMRRHETDEIEGDRRRQTDPERRSPHFGNGIFEEMIIRSADHD